MPYKWVDPEVFMPALEERDISIHYAYHPRHGGVKAYWYSIYHPDGEWLEFDIRDLADVLGLPYPSDSRNLHNVIILDATKREEFDLLAWVREHGSEAE